MNLRRNAQDMGGASLATIATAALALVVLIVIGAMWIFGFGLFQRGTADFRGRTGVTEQVHADPNYRIAQYNHFFDLCAQVQNTEATIAALRAELATNPPAERVTQINAFVTANTSNRAALINQYNADAGKTDTAANFRASNLPYILSIAAPATVCTA